MKRCPRCGRIYSETDINFCLDDGGLLNALSVPEYRDQIGRPSDDAPPTLVIDRSRPTADAGWQTGQPMAQWHQPSGVPVRPFSTPVFHRDTTLATVSLVLGIISIVLSCCYGGIWLGLPAAIVGFLATRNADRDPDHYSGRGMAIAGMIIGSISFAIALVILFFGVVARLP